MADYARKMAEYEDALKDAKRAKGERPDKPEQPTLPRVTVNDATAESRAPILKESPRGVVLVRDELIGWVQAMNQYREGGKGADQQFWLSVWSGGMVEVDRKKTHDLGPLRVRKPFIGVIGGLTPDKLPTLRGDKPRRRAEQDGFIDRILMTCPKEPPAAEENWMEVAEDTRQVWHDAFRKLRTLAMVPIREGGAVKGCRPFLVKPTGEARRAWQAFTRRHADERNGKDFPPHLIGPWSKLRGYCARLALIGAPNLEAIQGSLAVYGQRKPIVANRRTKAVIAGNGTLEAARALGWTHIAVVFTDDDPMTAAGFAIADNRTAELAEWDADALGRLLAEVQVEDERLRGMFAELAEAQGVAARDAEAPAPPEDFPEVDENVPTEHQCPKCGYRWSGGAA